MRLIDPNEQFVVLETELYSRLSGGATRLPGYNQVARNIACMAGVIESSGCSIERFGSLGFHVLVPESQIQKEATFKDYMQKGAVYQKVRQRVEYYRGRSDYENKRQWFDTYFEPLLDKIDFSLIPWEIIINSIGDYDKDTGEGLLKFYEACCQFNKPFKKWVT